MDSSRDISSVRQPDPHVKVRVLGVMFTPGDNGGSGSFSLGSDEYEPGPNG